MHLFYTPDIDENKDVFLLDETESKHAVRVLRLGKGDEVFLIDGRGGRYRATILDDHPKRTTLQIAEVILNYQKRDYFLHIAIAPTKRIERLEWFLEKATEVGIDAITPIICDHSERKDIKVERLNKVIVAAMKQSLKAYMPTLYEPIKFQQFLQTPFDGHRFIAHCVDSEEKQFISHTLGQGEASLVLIGPEGDFSEGEIVSARTAGFLPTTLGESRLRTETAALASVMEVAFLNR